jgi:universal stress protein E
MSWTRILFALAAPGAASPAIMAKVTQLARAAEAELELFHCVFDEQMTRARRFGSRSIEEDTRFLVAQRRQQLEAVAAPLRAQGLRVRTSVRWDHPAFEGIVRQVMRRRPSLVVIQSSRRSRLGRWMLTHTDYQLVENCPAPLLLLKSERPYANPRIVAAIDPLHTHDKPGALDVAILDAARAVSEALQGRLHVYHACEPWRTLVRQSPELRRLARADLAEAHASYCQQAEARVNAGAWLSRAGRSHAHRGEQGRHRIAALCAGA